MVSVVTPPSQFPGLPVNSSLPVPMVFVVTPPSQFSGFPVATPPSLFPRFENQQLRDRAAIQTPYTHTSFTTLGEAVGRLLPYHACAGPLPSRDHFHLGQQGLWVSSRDSDFFIDTLKSLEPSLLF